MPAADLLSRLTGVKPTGKGKWMACCPAHDDKTPSLAVTELNDGMVLVYCFAGCQVDAVLGAVGLEMDALFADGGLRVDRSRPVRGGYVASEVLRQVAADALVVAVAASRMARGGVMSEDDRGRVLGASERLQRAAEMAGGA